MPSIAYLSVGPLLRTPTALGIAVEVSTATGIMKLLWDRLRARFLRTHIQ